LILDYPRQALAFFAGSVSDDIRSRVQAADADTLLRWADRLFSAQTIEAIFD
jgi:hypothetical protein